MKAKYLHSIRFIIFFSTLILASCNHSKQHHEHDDGDEHKHEEGVIHFSEKQAKAAGLETETIQPGDFTDALRVSGQVTIAQGDEAVLVAKSAGVVSFLHDHLSEGMAVKTGDVFARISAEGIVGGDQVHINATALKKAESNYQRAKALYADTLISKRELIEAKAEYEQARNSMGGTAGTGTAVVTPISGFIKSVDVRQGEYVEVGQKIATITKSCNLQLRAEVPEKYFAEINNVKSANFEMSYGGGVQSIDALRGHVVAVGKTATEESAFIPLTFEFENNANIIPGSFADIWLLFAPRHNVLSVPSSAITEEQGVYYVYVQMDDEDEFEKREVVIGMNNGLRTEIKRGVTAGDKVVTKGVYQVKLAGSGSAPEAHSHNH